MIFFVTKRFIKMYFHNFSMFIFFFLCVLMCNFLSRWVTVKELTKLLALGTQRKHWHVRGVGWRVQRGFDISRRYCIGFQKAVPGE